MGTGHMRKRWAHVRRGRAFMKVFGFAFRSCRFEMGIGSFSRDPGGCACIRIFMLSDRWMGNEQS